MRDNEGGEIGRDPAADGAVALEELLQVHTRDVFHHHEVLPADLAEVVGLDDVGVDEVGHEPGLADEVLLELLDRRVLLADQFDRDDLLEISGAALVGHVDDTHAALRELLDHLIVDFVEDVFDRGHVVKKRPGPQQRKFGFRLWHEYCSLSVDRRNRGSTVPGS
jgi:hypothetical protein